MGKVIQTVISLVVLLVILGTLGVGIATLITVLNIQDVQNTVPSTSAPTPSDDSSSIPVAKPIEDSDPRYSSYKGMSDLLKTWMNTSVNPCEDFYSFTCGVGTPNQGMSFDVSDDAITESMLAELKKSASSFDNQPLPVRQMKWFYDTCVANTNTEKDFRDRSKRIFNDVKNTIGLGFPALYPKDAASKDPNTLGSFLGYVLGQQGVTSLVDIGVDTDWKDPHNTNGGYALLVDQPATIFIDTFYTKMYDADQAAETFSEYLQRAALLLEVTLDDKQLLKDAQALAAFDFDLATKYSTDDTTRRQYARSYNPTTVAQLQKLAPFLNWKSLFNKALAPVGKTVDDSFRSVVMESNMLAALSSDVASGQIAASTIDNYLNLKLLMSNYLPSLPTSKKMKSQLTSYRRHKRPINRKIRRTPNTDDLSFIMTDYTNLEANCLSLTTSYITWANTRVYVDANYPTQEDKETIRNEANSIIRSILVAFRAQIDLLDWMSPSSKKGAYQKIDNLVVNIAFPDWVLDNDKLVDYYKKLAIKSDDTYLEQADKLISFSLYEAFLPLVNGAAADRTDFSGPSAITNAWYQPEMNSITFPGGILHAPFYDPSYPAAINYGGLGVIAGHELTHGFDDEGVQWEGTGMLTSWMDDNSTKSFTSMAQCVVQEYNKFCPLGKGYPCVDGDQTQGENIADNGGIQAAYKAFKAYEALNGPDPLLPGDASMFNADQLFFIGFAQVWCQYPPSAVNMLWQILVDPHSPSLYRVLGTVQNIPAFQKAFNCPVASTYSPKDHCNVWTSEPTSGAPLNEKGEPIVPENDVNVAPVERISPQDMDKYSAYQNSLATLKASSNMSIDPCDDFYHYSCGNFPGAKTTFADLDDAIYRQVNDQINDEDYQATIKGSTALGKLKTLYDKCKAEAKQSTTAKTNYLDPKIQGFKKNLNQPISLIGDKGAAAISAEDYGNILGYLSFQLGIDTLVSPMVDTYWEDPVGKGYQLFVDQATCYHVRAFYEKDTWPKQKPDYKKTVKHVVEAYAKLDTTAKLPDNYDQLIDDVLELEQKIATTYSRTDAEKRLFKRQWNMLPHDAFPGTVDWDLYWSFSPKEGQDWIKTKDIVFNELDYTSKLFTQGLKGEDATVANYLFIRVLLANSGLIPCFTSKCVTVMNELAARKVPEHLGKSEMGRRHALPSYTRLNEEDSEGVGCASKISAMADAQGRVYIDARFPTQESRDRIRDVTSGVMTNIIDAMKGMIMQLDWMSDDSKTKAINKASNILVNVAYPDYILDNAQLDALYKDLVFDDADSYYAMLDKITLYSIGQDYKQLTATTANRRDFLGKTAVVNAWYDDELNSITFPAGILQQPFFDVNYPAGLNYGGLGVVAGHELTHGFDDKGVQWDFDGRLNSWMDAGSQEGFNTMAECVIEEYSKFCPLPEDRSPRCTDGTRTQGENIADNGGIHSGWRAYLSHIELDGPDAMFMDRVYSQYNNDQLYFLNFAQVWCMQSTYLTESYVSNRLMTDPHSLGPYRVLGTLQNIPAFRASFNCPLGSEYAPVDHCNVWVPTKMA